MSLEDLTALARAVERNWRYAWAALGDVATEPRSIVDDTSGFLRVYTPGISESLLNLVMSYQSPEPVTPEDVFEALAPYRQRALPAWGACGPWPARIG